MDELEKWAKDKPESLVMFAFIWATVADYLHLLLKDRGTSGIYNLTYCIGT